MKKRILLILFTLAVFSFGTFAQGITNNGATIVIESGTTVTVSNSGGYYNLTNGSNHGRIDIDGTLQITGDFENQTTDVSENVFINVGTDGTVVFAGTGDQHISNSTANAYIDFENVTVNNTVDTVFLDAGSAATVNGVLTVNAGGNFTLSSPADGEGPSGSLITNTGAAGNVTGTGELWVDRHFETNGRWVYFSVPVGNGSDDDFDNTNNSHPFNANLYTYSEGYNADPNPGDTDYSNWTAFYDAWYDNQIAVDGNDITMNGANALGYATYNELEIDVEFGGSPSDLNNAVSYAPAVSYTFNDANGGYYDGWNFVGNPYPVALDWNQITSQVGTEFANITNTVYMWDGDNGNYVYYNDEDPDDHFDSPGSSLNGDARYIPAMQGFFVKASGAPIFTIPDDARLHYQNDMYKSEDSKTAEFEYIKLRTEHDGFSDETIVRFLENATIAVDDAFDAYKMFPWSTPAMIYSIVLNPEIPVSINSLPISTVGTSVPLGFLTEEAGSYSISVDEYNFELSTEVKLIDTYLETETILDEGIEYSFTFDGGENRDRFYLFVAPEVVDIEEPALDNLETIVNVWSSENNVHITITSSELIDANVEIFDVLGKSVIQKRLNGTYNVVNVPGANGTYFVKLITNDGRSHLNKVFIQK